MDHNQATRLMDAQFEAGPLPALEARALRAHLLRCPSCRAYYDRLAALEMALFGGELVPDPWLERLLAEGPPAPQPPKINSSHASGFLLVSALAASFTGLIVAPARAPAPAQRLPRYALELSRGEQAQRGTDISDGPPRFAEKSHLELLLRPEIESSAPIQVSAKLIRGALVRPLELPFRRSSSGVLFVEGEAGALLERPPPGDWTLVLELGTQRLSQRLRVLAPSKASLQPTF